MLHEKSPRAIFGVLAIVLAISSPLIVLFTPMVQLSTFRHDSQNLLMTIPIMNYYLLSAAFIILIMIFAILAFKRNKTIYTVVTALFIISCGLVYLSSLSYIQIHTDFVRIKNFNSETTYPMNEMKTIVHEYGIDENGQYLFYTKDNEEIIIADTPLMDIEKQRKLYRIASEHGVEFIERAYKDE